MATVVPVGFVGFALAMREKDSDAGWELGQTREDLSTLRAELKSDLDRGFVTPKDLEPFEMQFVSVYAEEPYLP